MVKSTSLPFMPKEDMDNQTSDYLDVSLLLQEHISLGGPGSGHFGHAGIPGHRGGSLPRSSAMSIHGKGWEERQKAAKTPKFGTLPIASTSYLNEGEQGVNPSNILEFEDGSKGIFKYAMRHGTIESEVLAYEFSESIGWGIVPETVEFTTEGTRGSLQKWIDDAVCTYDFQETISSSADLQLQRMRTMDAFFENNDRHPGNYLIQKDGSRLWAIDNGAMFRNQDGRYKSRSQTFWPTLTEGHESSWKEVVAWSSTPKAADFRNRISTMLGPNYADTFDRAIEAVRKAYG